MSIADAKTFLARLKSDPDLMARFQAATSNEERKAIVNESGLAFTLAEVAEASAEGMTRLSDEQMAAIAGGGGSWKHKTVHGLEQGLDIGKDIVVNEIKGASGQEGIDRGLDALHGKGVAQEVSPSGHISFLQAVDGGSTFVHGADAADAAELMEF